MSVKICGVRTVDGARAVADSGAELAGLNFVPSSRRYLDPDHADPILRALGAALPVGVFAGSTVEQIDLIAGRLGLEVIQLHGREPPEVTAALCRRYRVIKAFALVDDFAKEELDGHVRWADWFLFDAARPGGGQTFDWSRLPESPRPFLLAGGLDATNVAAAVGRTAPFGVDTASGVESDGIQDPEKIAAFVRAAKGS